MLSIELFIGIHLRQKGPSHSDLTNKSICETSEVNGAAIVVCVCVMGQITIRL